MWLINVNKSPSSFLLDRVTRFYCHIVGRVYVLLLSPTTPIFIVSPWYVVQLGNCSWHRRREAHVVIQVSVITFKLLCKNWRLTWFKYIANRRLHSLSSRPCSPLHSVYRITSIPSTTIHPEPIHHHLSCHSLSNFILICSLFSCKCTYNTTLTIVYKALFSG